MLKYLVILLSDNSASFCRYNNCDKSQKLIPIEILKKGIVFGMKENLMIQFAIPDSPLPPQYFEAISSIDHTLIGSSDCSTTTDVIILDGWGFDVQSLIPHGNYVLKTKFEDLSNHFSTIPKMFLCVKRINLIINDIQSLDISKVETQYKEIIDYLVTEVASIYRKGMYPELNILTDRLYLGKMNNCGAGEEVLTLAPNGKFYICPAFYYGNHSAVGDIDSGVDIPNGQLFKIDHAPICRRCDAYHCQRCIWLNKVMTYECNTPSHEQCVLAHIERNGSARLRSILVNEGVSNLEDFEECSYLDPFDLIVK